MGKKLTHNEFVYFVNKNYDENYEILGTYVNTTTKLLMRHNNCTHPDGFYEWEALPGTIMYRRSLCPYCMHKVKLTTDEFVKRLNKLQPDLECLDEYKGWKEKLHFYCRICNGIFEKTPNDIRVGSGCPYCASTNKKALVGFNDMWTTHPYVAKFLSNPEDGYKYTYGTGKKLDWTCPDCGNGISKHPYIVLDEHGNFKCPKCGDGVSFPEKFFYNVLTQLGVKFKYQLSSKDFKWCGNFRYDFYIYDKQSIVEINGVQHYRDNNWGTVENVQKNDKNKKNTAFKNGILNYIVIDAKCSTVEYLKESILNSDIASWYDLSSIDWKECGTYATKSLLRQVCNEWISGVSTVQDMVDKFPIGRSCVLNYLNLGAELGICDYDSVEYNNRLNNKTKERFSKPVKCVEINVIYESVSDALRQTGIKDIAGARDNPNKTRGGYHWVSVDELKTYP